jgi:hypothetical protein
MLKNGNTLANDDEISPTVMVQVRLIQPWAAHIAISD